MEAPAGPPCFKCPSDFSASSFCPGPPFSQEELQSPSKQLWLIRAPASFSPESFNGHVVSLMGCQTLKASQPDGTQKVFRLQTTLGAPGGAQLLVPSGHADHSTCSPLFSGSLSISEKYGDPSGEQPLSPVVARAAPHIPEGLKQRFMPFGNHAKRLPPPATAEEPPRKKKKKKQEQLLEEKQLPPSAMPLGEASQAREAEAGQQLKQEAASWASGSPAEAQLCSTAFAQAGEVENLPPRNKKKKKGKEARDMKEEMGEAEGLLDSGCPKDQPWLASASEPTAGEDSPPGMQEAAQHKHEQAVPRGPISVKEETAGVMWDFLEATPKGEVLAEEQAVAGSSHHKAKKKKGEEARGVKEEMGEAEGLLDSGCSKHQPGLARDSEPAAGEDSPSRTQEGARHKHQQAVPMGPISVKEETAGVMWDFSGLEATPKGELVLVEEEPGAGSSHHKAKKKKKKKGEEARGVKEEMGEAGELLDSGCSKHQPGLARDSEPAAGEDTPSGMWEGALHKHEQAVPMEPLADKEETAGVMWDFLEATPKGELVLAEEEPGAGSSHHKAKKKKKKKGKENPEEAAQQQQGGGPAPQESGTVKQELDIPVGGGQETEPGAEEQSQRHKRKKAHRRWEAAEEGQEVGGS